MYFETLLCFRLLILQYTLTWIIPNKYEVDGLQTVVKYAIPESGIYLSQTV